MGGTFAMDGVIPWEWQQAHALRAMATLRARLSATRHTAHLAARPDCARAHVQRTTVALAVLQVGGTCIEACLLYTACTAQFGCINACLGSGNWFVWQQTHALRAMATLRTRLSVTRRTAHLAARPDRARAHVQRGTAVRTVPQVDQLAL